MTSYRIAILTVSDRCFSGDSHDASGPAVRSLCESHFTCETIETALVPDDTDAIQSQLLAWRDRVKPPHLILTTGGTGLAPRDVTPEATRPVLTKPAPQLLDLARQRCLPQTPHAYLSRGEAGVMKHSLVINLPGSPKGATQIFTNLLDQLPHLLNLLADPQAPHPS